MSGVSARQMLLEAHAELAPVGFQLARRSIADFRDAIYRLLRVQTDVLDVLDLFPEDDALQGLYSDCAGRDSLIFASMVPDLLIEHSTRCAYDLGSRYQSIICALMKYLGKPGTTLSTRGLTSDATQEAPRSVEFTHEYMSAETRDLQIELHIIEQRFKKDKENSPEDWKEIAIDLVFIRELFHQFFGEIHENAPREKRIDGILAEFNTAFYEDADDLGHIVTTIVDWGMVPEGISLIHRLIDFASRIAEFFEKGKYEIFSERSRPYPPKERSVDFYGGTDW